MHEHISPYNPIDATQSNMQQDPVSVAGSWYGRRFFQNVHLHILWAQKFKIYHLYYWTN